MAVLSCRANPVAGLHFMDTCKKKWEARYANNDAPWDTGRHDSNLEGFLAQHPIAPCEALELGCGTGTNAIWLTSQGFDVTAVDVSALALATAREKARTLSGVVAFVEIDICCDSLPEGPFGFVFDRGCFHSPESDAERVAIVEKVHAVLEPEGIWLSMIGSADGPPREVGPPKLSALQIAGYVEPLFEIQYLKAIHFDSDQSAPPSAWLCLMKKRNA